MMVENNTKPEPSPLKKASISIQPGMPLIVSEVSDEPAESVLPSPNESDRNTQQVGRTIKAYLSAARSLLNGKYAGLRSYAPPHLRDESTPFAVLCTDGILVRYDPVPNPGGKVTVGIIQRCITELAPAFSESVVHCPIDPTNYDLGPGGVTLAVSSGDHPTGAQAELFNVRVAIIAPLRQTGASHQAGALGHPVPVLSVFNEITVVLQCQMQPKVGASAVESRDFIVHAPLRLPVGWQVIEIYPPFDPEQWKPESAGSWAESDLLAAVARRHAHETELRAIDPNAAARRHYSGLLGKLQGLLGGPEEPVHQFLKAHPELISPTHIKVWSKLPLGSSVTDFVFQEPPNEYLMVELESPIQPLFRQDGQEREEVVHARDQIANWQRYVEDNLNMVQRELGLEGISSRPRFMIVIGRSENLTEENRRKLTTLQNMTPGVRILTYDDLLLHARAGIENLLGPLWNLGEGVEVYFLPRRSES